MKNIEVKTWFYDKLNKERGLDQNRGWLYLSKAPIVRETEKAYLLNWNRCVWDDKVQAQVISSEQIWVPKSCVTVF